MSDHKKTAEQLLSLVHAVYVGGREIIGDRWTLYKRMSDLADRGNVIAMARYFDECLESDRGQRVARKLAAARRETLEDKEPQFNAIVARYILESKLAYHHRLDGARSYTPDVFDELLSRRRISAHVGNSLRLVVRARETSSIKRLAALPSLDLRRTPHALEGVARYIREAAVSYLLEMYAAAAVLTRAALELVLDELVVSRKGVRLRRAPERLQLLLAQAATILTEDQQRDARRIKDIGDRAAHGELADATAARDALVKLRRLIQATFK